MNSISSLVNPYRTEGPALVSFSGGRTSGYMLWKVLEAWGGELPHEIRAVFANTGKEREETLSFVHACENHWGLKVHWLEWHPGDPPFAEVTYETASRNGEPFDGLIDKKQFLPNPVARFCTVELKIRVMRNFARALGWDNWMVLLGLRADEPRRVDRARANNGQEAWDNEMPMVAAGVTLADVETFWQIQPFGLELKPWESNCDLCFLKGKAKKLRIMTDRPDLADWWIAQEQKPFGGGAATFRYNRETYGELLDMSQRQIELPFGVEDDLQCHICTP